jgi:hypothetical protein
MRMIRSMALRLPTIFILLLLSSPLIRQSLSPIAMKGKTDLIIMLGTKVCWGWIFRYRRGFIEILYQLLQTRHLEVPSWVWGGDWEVSLSFVVVRRITPGE